MTVKERIQEYLNYKGVSPTSAERELGWGNGAFTKAKSITVDRAKELLLYYPDLSAEWLLRGTGNMILNESSNSTQANDFDETWYKKIVNDQHDLIQMQKERIKFLEKMVQKADEGVKTARYEKTFIRNPTMDISTAFIRGCTFGSLSISINDPLGIFLYKQCLF